MSENLPYPSNRDAPPISTAAGGLPATIDPGHLGRAGWAIVFHTAESPAVREALTPLIEHRRRQAGAAKTRVLEYRDGDDWRDWLAHQEVTAGRLESTKIPYYLLLVGHPARIPYDFQILAGLEYAVGRVSFSAPVEYRRYVESVIAHETTAEAPRARTTVFFAPRHPFDPVTRLTADLLVKPLMDGTAATRTSSAQPGVAAARGFSTIRLWGDDATKVNLEEILGGRGGGRYPPALIFAAAHGLGFPRGHPRQSAAQGGLLCQAGRGGRRIDSNHCFNADDLSDRADIRGLIAFLLASYGVGTPERDPLLSEVGGPPRRIADEPFVASLPQRLLAHPRGGALAVIGLIDHAYSLAVDDMLRQSGLLRDTLDALMAGRPVGYALESLNRPYAERSGHLSALAKKLCRGTAVAGGKVAAARAERNETGSFVVVGDPAVRLKVEDVGGWRPRSIRTTRRTEAGRDSRLLPEV